MKNAVLMCLAVLMFVSGSNVFAGVLPEFGFKGGVNNAKIVGDDSDLDARNGVVAGVYASLGIPFLFSIQPEVLLSMKGGKSPSGSSPEYTYKLNYLEVPVLFKYTLIPAVVASADLFAGPYYGIKLSAKGKNESDGSEADLDSIKSSDVGFVVGARVKLSKISLGARYSRSLSSISDGSGSPKNSVISVLLGFSIL